LSESIQTREEELVNVETGERLPATIQNAAVVLEAARAMKQRLNDVVWEATQYLVEESRRLGTKTFLNGSLVLSGGVYTDYDVEELRERLTEEGCP
jgi:hypothetical protein